MNGAASGRSRWVMLGDPQQVHESIAMPVPIEDINEAETIEFLNFSNPHLPDSSGNKELWGARFLPGLRTQVQGPHGYLSPETVARRFCVGPSSEGLDIPQGHLRRRVMARLDSYLGAPIAEFLQQLRISKSTLSDVFTGLSP
jgi:hypothetical protein